MKNDKSKAAMPELLCGKRIIPRRMREKQLGAVGYASDPTKFCDAGELLPYRPAPYRGQSHARRGCSCERESVKKNKK